MKVIIRIVNNNVIYEPAVEDGIQWTTERKGSPGKLTFKVINDDLLNITEGNSVSLIVDDTCVFYGYIFSKSRDKNRIISVTAYDQLRYFKNKDTYMYTNKKASDVLKMIAEDFNLKCGSVEDTGYVIAKKLESNQTLFDIVQSALDATLMNTKKLYVLYDDCGRLTLKNIASMKLGLIIDEETGQNFDYKSSIDSQTYDQVKLTFDNEKTGKRDVYMAKDSSNINNWGILQFYDTLQDGENGAYKAEQLLSYYNKKTRTLSIKDAFGDVRVRAGVSPLIRLKLGDIEVNNYMVCEKVTHTFKDNQHTMSLDVIGGEFIA